MLMTKRKPASAGEILVEEFMQQLGLTQDDLADAMGVPRKHVNVVQQSARDYRCCRTHAPASGSITALISG
jgi:plasmid maintenance system antidote protein VapI